MNSYFSCILFLVYSAKAFVPLAPLLSKSLLEFGFKPFSDCNFKANLSLEPNIDDPLKDLDESRKNNLFQCLLRDLQIEGTPILECDSSQAHTLQAALWTTMAELSEQDDAQKVCLVLEDIGVEALRTFVDDFLILKTQQRLMDHLPELERFSLTLVGKGAGPAIVIETDKKPESCKPAEISGFQEVQVHAAMKAFVDRHIVRGGVCPYTKSANKAPKGLEGVNIQPGPVGYRFCGSSEVCHVLSAFWNCICELLSVNDEILSCVVLSIPAIGSGEASINEAHDRFSAVAELISRSLCIYRGDDVFEILHFSPLYDRNRIYPTNKPAHGHLPPTGWIRSMLRHSGKAEADTLSDQDLELSNFQRRSPFTAVVIKRVAHFEALAGSANEIVDLEIEDGQVEKASGIACYTSNAVALAVAGKEELQSALDAEIDFNSTAKNVD